MLSIGRVGVLSKISWKLWPGGARLVGGGVKGGPPELVERTIHDDVWFESQYNVCKDRTSLHPLSGRRQPANLVHPESIVDRATGGSSSPREF